MVCNNNHAKRLNRRIENLGLRLARGGSFLLFFAFLLCAVEAEIPVIESVQSQVRLENLLTGMALAPDDSVWVAENDSGELSRIRRTALSTSARIDRVMTGFIDPVGLQFDSRGRLFVAERSTGRVYLIDNNQRSIFLRGYEDIASIRLDSNDIFIVEMEPGRVTQHNLNSNISRVVFDRLSFPSDVLSFGRSLMTGELVDRAGSLGRIMMEPIEVNPIPIPPIFDWDLEDSVIDPIRFAVHPIRGNEALVSVRHLEPQFGIRKTPGGVFILDMVRGQLLGRYLTGLHGPTDVVPIESGCYVLEENAERISFFDWDGNRIPVWDGLGQPTAFAITNNPSMRYLVAESSPYSDVSVVSGLNVRPGFLPEELREQAIYGIASGLRTYVSLTQQGRIAYFGDDNQVEVLTRDVSFPGKLVNGAGNSLWVIDAFSNEIMKISETNGSVLLSVPAASLNPIDFHVEVTDNRVETLYVLDEFAEIWRWNRLRARFEAMTILQSDEVIFSRKTFPPKFTRVEGQGFIIALNDESGSILWLGDDGEQSTLARGYKEIVQIESESSRAVSLLSNRGWIRTLRLMFESEQPVPTPTPPAPISPTPAPPTPTPTPTGIFDWSAYEG